MSESEVELDGPQNEVTLPQDLPGRGNVKLAKSAIRCQHNVILNHEVVVSSVLQTKHIEIT